MTRRETLADFYGLFLKLYSENQEISMEQAYEHAEDQFIKDTGERIYRNYNSFRRAKSYHHAKGQHV